MDLAIGLGLLPVIAAGGALWLREGSATVLAARSLALGATLSVVALILLPEAAGRLGLVALVAVAAGWGLPRLIEGLGSHRGHADHHAGGLALATLGVAVHQLADGLQLGAAARAFDPATLLAIGVHGVPLVLVVLLAVARGEGRAIAVRVWLGLVAVTALGLVGGSWLLSGWVEAFEPWVQAGTAGLLLHLLTHDLGTWPADGRWSRLVDVAALAAGIAVTWMAMGAGKGPPSLDALSATAALAGPPLAVALVTEAALTRWPGRPAGLGDALLVALLAGSYLGAWFAPIAAAALGLVAFTDRRAAPSQGAVRAADELLLRAGPGLLLAVVVAAALQEASARELAPLARSHLDLAALGLASLAIRGPGLAPLAAAALHQGASPAGAMALVLTAPVLGRPGGSLGQAWVRLATLGAACAAAFVAPRAPLRGLDPPLGLALAVGCCAASIAVHGTSRWLAAPGLHHPVALRGR